MWINEIKWMTEWLNEWMNEYSVVNWPLRIWLKLKWNDDDDEWESNYISFLYDDDDQDEWWDSNDDYSWR